MWVPVIALQCFFLYSLLKYLQQLRETLRVMFNGKSNVDT